MEMTNEDYVWICCYHEAGHAVVAHCLGANIAGAIVREDASGVVHPMSDIGNDDSDDRRVFTFAGVVSEQMFASEAYVLDSSCWRSDYDAIAKQAAERLGASADQLSRPIVQISLFRAWLLVEKWQSFIRDCAIRIFQCERRPRQIGHLELVDICRDAPRESEADRDKTLELFRTENTLQLPGVHK